MALTVEDGTGVSGANSYVSLVEAAAYHTLYNNTSWVGTNSELEQALILATRSLDLLYGPKFLSYKKTQSASPLLFPRMPFYDNNQELVQYTVPTAIKNATCEIALMSLTGTNIFPLPNTNSDVKVNKVKIGDIEIDEQFVSKSPVTETYEGFRMVDIILFPVLKQGNDGFVQLYR